MTKSLIQATSTLIVKVPSQIAVPAYKEKSSAQKNIVRAIGKILQKTELELIYVGPSPDTQIDYIDPETFTEDSTVITINVLDDNINMRDFNTSPQALLKSFKKEIQSNSEHILIDKNIVINDKTERRIEIYIKSRHSIIKTAVPAYTFAQSINNLEYSRTW